LLDVRIYAIAHLAPRFVTSGANLFQACRRPRAGLEPVDPVIPPEGILPSHRNRSIGRDADLAAEPVAIGERVATPLGRYRFELNNGPPPAFSLFWVACHVWL